MSPQKPSLKMLFRMVPKIAATAAVLATAASHASAISDPKRIIVSFADLNLESQSGSEELLRRVRNAAETVCADLNSISLAARARYQTCVRDVTQRALADVREIRK